MKFVIIFTNSAEPDEMPHNAAFHTVLHCLQKYLFAGTVLPAKSDSDAVFCLQSYQGLRIDRSLDNVY